MAKGVQRDDGFQLRAESDKSMPITFGHKHSTPADTPKIPGSIAAPPPRQMKP
jgi:hypothetical protein